MTRLNGSFYFNMITYFYKGKTYVYIPYTQIIINFLIFSTRYILIGLWELKLKIRSFRSSYMFLK